MDFLADTENIRNICILAHVDHGKTTIADSLIASNGIISQRMAGQIRYMDNRQDEQERGITMKSSSIALKYSSNLGKKYLINLVDTPGHVDFCGEVSAAVRLCDGALIVIDVVEGVCPQTKVALEHAWKEGIEPILVLNKIDRLILEQKLDETAACVRLNQLLEQVNAIVATLMTTEIFYDESSAATLKSRERTVSEAVAAETANVDSMQIYDWASAIEDIDDDKYYFTPSKNNVVFASSIDDWAFTVETFANILSEKHKINLNALRKTLWGDFYIDTKQRRIMKNAQAKSKKNLFVSMVLDSIWRIYDTVCTRRDKIKTAKICEALDIRLSQRDLNHVDSRYQTKLIMSKWIQLSKNVLESVAIIVPSPKQLSEKRVERLLCSTFNKFDQLPPETQSLKQSFLDCSSSEEAVKLACVSKMIAFERETGPIFICFARIFSGTLAKGDKLYVLGPRHKPNSVTADTASSIDASKRLEDLGPGEHVTIATIDNLYLFMGRDIEQMDVAPAGNIVGITGLEGHIVRTATLASNLYCPPFNDLHVPSPPILRVAVEPKNPSDMATLVSGLKLLNQADPCVEVRLQQNGEHVIIATGEVHLERCIKDLRERYANMIELNVSQPIVPFRETLVLPPKTDMVNETIDDKNTGSKPVARGAAAELLTPNKKCRLRIRASPLPESVLKALQDSAELLKSTSKLLAGTRLTSEPETGPDSELNEATKRRLKALRTKLNQCSVEARKASSQWKHHLADDFADRLWSFGPKYCGPNLLVASPDICMDYSIWSRLDGVQAPHFEALDDPRNYIDSFISGFQLASQSGPLCEEPLMGVCFTVLEWSAVTEADLVSADPRPDTPELDVSAAGPRQKESYGPMSGQIISTVKDCCRKSFQMQPQRLMTPMFCCDIQVTGEVLGKMYAVLGRRNGRIVHGDMREGSQTFDIQAYIPVIESLDFASDIRKQTSGMASPQLIFSHYEIIDVDPFWTPNTDEEYALFGDKADTENQARKYMNLVRRRKGLSVQEKTVEHAEKQRTIKRNK